MIKPSISVLKLFMYVLPLFSFSVEDSMGWYGDGSKKQIWYVNLS